MVSGALGVRTKRYGLFVGWSGCVQAVLFASIVTIVDIGLVQPNLDETVAC